MPQVQVLLCQPSYVPDIISLWYRCTCQHQAFISDKYWREITPSITALLYQHSHSSLIAIAEQRLVGFITVIENELAALFVDSSMQRVGIGTLLLEQIEKKRQLSSVKVYAANKTAMAFYQQHGFTELSRQLQIETDQLLITMQR